MKRFLILLCLVMLGLPAMAQEEESAKDLFYRGRTGHRPRPGQQQRPGRPGAMVRIELNRNGKLSYVTPATTFRTGDRVRLHVKINRSAYLTILNEGTSGGLQVLYPRTAADAQARVAPTLDFTIPTAKDKWLEFDQNEGTEKLHIMLSAQPVPAVAEYLGAHSDSGGHPRPHESVVDTLNSKGLRGELEESGKDFTEVGEGPAEDGQPAVYAVTTSANASLKKPIVYKLLLRHAK